MFRKCGKFVDDYVRLDVPDCFRNGCGIERIRDNLIRAFRCNVPVSLCRTHQRKTLVAGIA
jgi:hypothetical protein